MVSVILASTLHRSWPDPIFVQALLVGKIRSLVPDMPPAPIWICLVTKDNMATVQRAVRSAAGVCRRFGHRNVHLLVLDKSKEDSGLERWLAGYWPNGLIYQGRAEVLERDLRHVSWYVEAGHDLEHDSVQRARIQLTLATKELGHLVDGILWQIDDDMCFQEAHWNGTQVVVRKERDYFSEVRACAVAHPKVDAVIGRCTNAPPLPALLYMRHQLMDLAMGRAPAPVLSTDGQSYHDLYDLEPRTVVSKVLLERPSQIPLPELMAGTALTRPIINGSEDPLSLGSPGSILRGGNFIIFNRSIVEVCIHPGFRFAGRIARRSDMAHLWVLQRNGIDLRPIELSLFHDRRYQASTPSRLVGDYLDDALGAMAIRSLKSMDAAQVRLEAHEAHMRDLVVLLEQHNARSLMQALSEGLDELRTWQAAGLNAALEEYRTRMFERTQHAAYEGAGRHYRPE